MSANLGEDSARLHQSTNQEEEEIAVHLFRGHYTSCLSFRRINCGLLRKGESRTYGNERYAQKNMETGDLNSCFSVGGGSFPSLAGPHLIAAPLRCNC